MAYVDISKNKLVLKAVIAGPPKVGKTERIYQIREGGSGRMFGSKVRGFTQMAAMPLEAQGSVRPVEIEFYEWHGPEKADIREGALFTGLDGLIYIADAREDRWVDTEGAFKYLLEMAGKSRIQRLPAMLLLGRQDEGLLRLPTIEKKLEGPTWSERLDVPHDAGEPFVEAVRLFGEVMLARVL